MTYFFVPDMTGVDLADEDAAFLKYLAENGWEGKVGEDDDLALAGNYKVVDGVLDSEEGEGESGKDVKI